jgi:hypothetical protein
VYNFHHKTVHALVEMLAASGLKSPSELGRKHIFRRISMSVVKRYDQLYPDMPEGCLLNSETVPELYKQEMLGEF